MKLCGFEVGLKHPLFVIAGPCVIESEQLAIDTAGYLKEITSVLNIPFIYKSSYDKANRSSDQSFRGLGIEKGLHILSKIKQQIQVPVLTDVHTEKEVPLVAEVVDVLQTPAFLARQTDFIHTVAQSGKPVNIKKGQFMAPKDMLQVIQKARNAALEIGLEPDSFMVCERGASFGYHNLVSDMRSLMIMRETKCPVIFDATHSVQLPGEKETSSGGRREFVPILARAAVASGIAGIFMETHPNPKVAKSDGPNAVPLSFMKELLYTLKEIDALIKQQRLMEYDFLAFDAQN
ncbi:MAG: 3-deoxy-8-phosphooctulonate synthase [Neisseriaceae bacterium]|nr:MAG: 3-deoxy-8-phosphooctulonate synthase [Neisseriaceae bacterium]